MIYCIVRYISPAKKTVHCVHGPYNSRKEACEVAERFCWEAYDVRELGKVLTAQMVQSHQASQRELDALGPFPGDELGWT